jgi:hypothetical protein
MLLGYEQFLAINYPQVHRCSIDPQHTEPTYSAQSVLALISKSKQASSASLALQMADGIIQNCRVPLSPRFTNARYGLPHTGESIMNASIDRLHDKARRAITSSEDKLREAAEYLWKAKQLGASQRQTAKAIGKSPAWVNRLLKWRDRGYPDTPFGPQAKTKRANAVQATKRSPATPEQAQAQTAKANAERAKAEAQRAKSEFQKARALAAAEMFASETKRIPGKGRQLLIRALKMLSSGRAAERANAALIVENQRARLNLAWGDLIVPADASEVENELGEAA